MEIKKSKQANLEKKRVIFFEYGILLALTLMLVAFESGSTLKQFESEVSTISDNSLLILPPVTKPPPPLPPPPPPIIINFKIVEPEIEIDEKDLVFSTESTITEALPIFIWEEKPEKVEEIEYTFNPEQHPSFQGGDIEKFRIWVQRNLNYNEEALKLRLQGRITVKFIIDEKGNLTMPEVLRGIDPLLDNEVISTLNRSPKWKPGKQHMIPVKVAYVIPVIFRLE